MEVEIAGQSDTLIIISSSGVSKPGANTLPITMALTQYFLKSDDAPEIAIPDVLRLHHVPANAPVDVSSLVCRR